VALSPSAYVHERGEIEVTDADILGA